MAFKVLTNIQSTRAQTVQMKAQRSLSKSYERLSSGLRIIAADDAAGLSITTRMEAQNRGVTRAVGNANDAISLSQTADGAMNEVGHMLQRMRELSVQAASDSLTDDDRQKSKKSSTSSLKRSISARSSLMARSSSKSL